PSESFVRGGGHRVRMRHGRWMQAGNHRARDVRDVGEHARAHALGDFANALEIDDARVSRRATYQKLWLVFFGKTLQLVVVNRFRFARDTIVGNFVTQSGKIKRMAVRQVAAK